MALRMTNGAQSLPLSEGMTGRIVYRLRQEHDRTGGIRKGARRVSAQRANAWGKATSTALEVLAEILRCAQDDRQGTKNPPDESGGVSECGSTILTTPCVLSG